MNETLLYILLTLLVCLAYAGLIALGTIIGAGGLGKGQLPTISFFGGNK